jgi:hypothetical protein
VETPLANVNRETAAHWQSLPVFWFSSHVASHHLAVALQSCAKDQFHCTVDYTTLYSNCEAQKLAKNRKNNLR